MTFAIHRGMSRLLGAAAIVAGLAAPAQAQQTFEFAVWYSDRDYYAPMTTKWAQQVEQVTEGRVKMKLHYSGSLVPAKDTVAAVRNGSVGGGTTSISFLAGIVRELSYMEPFFWIPAEAKAGQDMMDKLTPPSRALMEQRGMALMFGLPSSGLITACRGPHIKTVADWKGKKVRAAGRWQGLLALAFTRDLPRGAMSDGMFLSVVCAEDWPRIAADAIAKEAEGRLMGTSMFETQMKPCEFWPRGVVPDGYYGPVTS